METFRSAGYGGPIHLTPYALDTGTVSPPGFASGPNLLFLGALDWNPNIEGLKWFTEKVWKPLKTRRPESRFYVAGRNPDASLAAYLTGFDVRFLGELNETSSFYKRGRIVVVPVRAGSGIRVKIIESMALGQCVVTTKQGMEGIQAQPGHDLFIADSAQEFLRILTDLIDNQNICEKIGKQARDFVRENFDIFKHSKELMNFFNSLS